MSNYTVNLGKGWEVEVTENDRNSDDIFIAVEGGAYSNSLAYVDDNGTIEGERGSDIKVPEWVLKAAWAVAENANY